MGHPHAPGMVAATPHASARRQGAMLQLPSDSPRRRELAIDPQLSRSVCLTGPEPQMMVA
jgi:hypothetical protein